MDDSEQIPTENISESQREWLESDERQRQHTLDEPGCQFVHRECLSFFSDVRDADFESCALENYSFILDCVENVIPVVRKRPGAIRRELNRVHKDLVRLEKSVGALSSQSKSVIAFSTKRRGRGAIDGLSSLTLDQFYSEKGRRRYEELLSSAPPRFDFNDLVFGGPWVGPNNTVVRMRLAIEYVLQSMGLWQVKVQGKGGGTPPVKNVLSTLTTDLAEHVLKYIYSVDATEDPARRDAKLPDEFEVDDVAGYIVRLLENIGHGYFEPEHALKANEVFDEEKVVGLIQKWLSESNRVT